MCDAFNSANDKIVNIVCNGNAITNDLMEKIVCDVPANGNVFLGVTMWDVYIYERKRSAVTDCVGCTYDRK